MKFFDLQHPFYKPLWIRALITTLCLGWATVEFVMGAPFWGMLFGALGIYCIHQFFVAFKPREPEGKDKP